MAAGIGLDTRGVELRQDMELLQDQDEKSTADAKKAVSSLHAKVMLLHSSSGQGGSSIDEICKVLQDVASPE
eukprot:gene3542-3993_t